MAHNQKNACISFHHKRNALSVTSTTSNQTTSSKMLAPINAWRVWHQLLRRPAPKSLNIGLSHAQAQGTVAIQKKKKKNI